MQYRALLGQHGQYFHTFGHDEGLRGLMHPKGWQTGHLCVTLDTSDPAISQFALAPAHIARLRLIFPFCYEQGSPFCYRQLSDNEIRWVGTAPNLYSFESALPIDEKHDPFDRAPDSWPREGFPDCFPSQPLILSKASIPSRRGPDGFFELGVDYEHLTIGAGLPTLQDYYTGNMVCVACAAQGSLIHAATLPAHIRGGVEIWPLFNCCGLFWVCANCFAITVHNEID